jgi:plasmid stabilization system protein ParE
LRIIDRLHADSPHQRIIRAPVSSQKPSPPAHVSRQKGDVAMPQGDKGKYTDKQKRKAEHIEEGYEKRGTPKKEAESRAWATVNKESGGGNKSGSGRGKPDTHVSSKRGGKRGGAASANRSAADRSAAAKKGWETRRKSGRS